MSDRDDLRLILIRRNRILAKLSIIADADAGVPFHERTQYEGKGIASHRPSGTSTPPRGARLGEQSGAQHAPSKRLSLHAHYRWHFERAGADIPRLMRLCAMAERDYLKHTGKWEHRGRESQTHEEQVRDLLANWCGCHSSEVAYWLECDEKWVRRQRVLSGLEPNYGDEYDNDPRRKRIVELANRGASTRTIAVEVGVSSQRVSQVLAGA